jgi:hypothetical protein
MGMLFKTHNTNWLIAHLNHEFSTYVNFYQANANLFNPGGGAYRGLLNVVTTLTDAHSPRPDHLVLMPYIYTPGGGANPHPRLETRWKWFLDPANVGYGSLTGVNDAALAQDIYNALINPKYVRITFDAAETTGAQAVASSEVYDDGTWFKQILLYTQIPNYVAGGV